MRVALLRLVTPALLGAVLGQPAPAAPDGGDEHTLRDAGLAADGAALLAFFRGRARPDVQHDQVLAWARQLGDSDAVVHTRAAAALVTCGPAAIPDVCIRMQL